MPPNANAAISILNLLYLHVYQQSLPESAPAAARAPLCDVLAAVHRLEAALLAPAFGGVGVVGPDLGVVDVAVACDLHPLLAPLRATLTASCPRLLALVEGLYAQKWFSAGVDAGAAATAAAGAGAAAGVIGGGASKRARGGAACEPSATAAAAPSSAGGGKAAVKAAAAAPVDLLSAVSSAAPLPASVVEDALDDSGLMTGSLLSLVREVFSTAIRSAFAQSLDGMDDASAASVTLADVSLNAVPKLSHHFQCNSALSVPTKLKGRPGAPPHPRAAAEAIVAALASSPARSLVVARTDISGPGYINVYVSGGLLFGRMAFALTHGVRCARPPVLHTVAVDYSSPNIAKEMHIGHLRSTIIGDTLARILEFAGHTVHRINHVGDWGTQFGMLIAHLKDVQAAAVGVSPAAAVASAAADAHALSIGDLTAFYKTAKARFDKEPEFKTRAHHEVVALQAGDPINRAMWQSMVDVSSAMFNEVYSRLSVDKRLTMCGESFYNSRIPAVIEELSAKGLLEDSDGALVLRVPGQEVPLMVRKGDGGFGYDSTDLTALKYRLQELHADWIIYVVDLGQSLHFDLVFGGGVRAGWYTPGAPGAPRVQHTGFGVVQGEDRKKFKTRSGETVRLVDVLEEARTRARAILLERATAAAAAPSSAAAASAPAPLAAAPPQLDAAAEHAAAVLGYGGVKYFDLRQNRTSDYVFNYDRMLSPDGDTAVYMQYAHARICSILRKAAAEFAVDVPSVVASTTGVATSAAGAGGGVWAHPSEVALALELARFQEVVEEVQVDLLPHHVCEYLFRVAQCMSNFHRDCPVLRADVPPETRDNRLRVCAATSLVMKTALGLLGIEALERI